MKNFFKKLSFVLAIAMVLTTVVPATASAAGKNYMELNGKKVTSVTAWIGGVTRNLDYNVGGKTSGVKGTWKVGNTSVATINAYGVVTPVANGTTKVRFTPADNSGAVTITLKVRTRAAALHVYDPVEYEAGTKNKLEGTTVELNAGDTKNLRVTMPVSKKAAGSVATYFLYAQVSDETVVSATVDTITNRSVTLKGLAAGEATVTLLANQTTEANVKSNKYYKEVSFTVKVNEVSELSAKQVGANKIEVRGKDLTEKAADYSLKLINTSKSIASAKLQEDGSVLLTTEATYLESGEYTLTFGTDETTFTAEKAKVTKIVVDPDKAILDSTKKGAYVYYKVLNQFDEDVTAKNSTLTVTTSAPSYSLQSSKSRVYVNGYTTELTLGMSQISLSLVDTNTGVAYSGVLSVADESRLASIKAVGVYDLGGAKKYDSLKAGLSNTDALKLYLLFEGVDQYGIPFDPANASTTNFNVSIASVTGLTTTGVIGVVGVEGVEYFGAQLAVKNSTNSDKLVAGEANYTAIVLTSGQTQTGTIAIDANQQICSLKISTTDTVYGNKRAQLAYTALDQDGKEITDITVLKRMNYKANSTTGFKSKNIYFAGSRGGVAKLYYEYDIDGNLATLTTTSPQSLTWICEDLSFDSLIINVNADRYATSVVGVWPQATTDDDNSDIALAENNNVSLTANLLKYEDQYGNVIAFNEFASVVLGMNSVSNIRIDGIEVVGAATNLTITPAMASGAAITSGSAVVLTAATTTTDVTTNKIVKITSSYKTSTMSQKATNVVSITYYGVNDSDVTYAISTGDVYRNNTTTARTIAHGIAGSYGANRVKATINVNYTDVSTNVNALGAYSTTNNAEANGTLVVTNKESGEVVTKTYKVANAPAKASAASVYGYFDKDWADAYTSTIANWGFFLNGYATIANGGTYTLSDNLPYATQYYDGDEIYVDDDYIVAYSELPDEAVVATGTNGTKDAAISFTEAGWYTVKVTVTWKSGLVYTETLCFKQN